jgi:CelD/BcsL family acetyltransferase involved in cellulose biosynthesis
MTGPRPDVKICAGRSFLHLLSDPTFCRQWDSLFAACPWATALQSRAFAAIWYSSYASVFDPLCVYALDATGGLAGLLALALNRKTRDLVHVGAHQAEYHVWLSIVEDGGSFIESALDKLADRFPGARLRLLFLPPGAPVDWLKPPRPWAGRARLRPIQRPLMAVGVGGNVEESLRKKSNKSRISRLRQLLGPVRLEVLHSRKEIEPLFDRIVDFCDFRNGAYYQCLPFRDDPLKREFYLRLVDSPELTHASVLRAGDETVAVHIGVRNGTSVLLGLITHSPFYSEHSPGKLLLLLLGRELGNEGFQDLDLTPGGEYKDRFATHSDTVYAGYIFFRRRDVHLHDFSRWVVGLAKVCLARVGVTPESARRRFGQIARILRTNTPHVLALKSLRWAARRAWSETQLNFYQMSPEVAAGMDRDARFRQDSLADLLLYERVMPADRSKFEFLRDALARLESGGHAYTAADGKRLANYAWLSPVAGLVGTDLGSKIDLPPGSISLWDDYTHPASRGLGLHQAGIRTRLRDASRLVKDGRIFISVLADNGPSRHNIECAGFRWYATVVRRFRLGKATWEWNFEH